jgi:16S rRNA (guanine527-N7)-methyltransferase
MSKVATPAQYEQLERQLEYGLTSMKLSVDREVQILLLDYLKLLQKWNHVYNLTAVRDPEQMVCTHLLDSLSVLPHIPKGRILDVGAGAGLPGIPLAAAAASSQFSLIESSQKKSAFLRQAVGELGLTNAQVFCMKVEDWRPPIKFNCIIARAYSELCQFIETSKHLLETEGIFAAMKGRYPATELDHIPAGFAVKKVIELQVPGLNAARHLVLVGRV